GGMLAQALTDLLAARSVDARSCLGDSLPDGTSVVIMTQLLDDEPPSIPELYGSLRSHLLSGAGDLVVVSGLGGGLGVDPPAPLDSGDPIPPGVGIRGLVKTAAIEFGERRVRLVDVDRSEPLDRLAVRVADEVGDPGGPVEGGWRRGVRRTPVLHWAGPSLGETESTDLGLTAESVVLLTCGAGGLS